MVRTNVLYQFTKYENTNVMTDEFERIENFDIIFASRDRKSQNEGLSNCADHCLVSSCEVSKFTIQSPVIREEITQTLTDGRTDRQRDGRKDERMDGGR